MTNGVMVNNIATNTGNGFAVTLQCENIAISNNVSTNSTAHNYLVDKFVSAGGTLMKNIVLSGNVGKNAGTGGVGNNYKVLDSDDVLLDGNIGQIADDSNFYIEACSNAKIIGGSADQSATKEGVLVMNSNNTLVSGVDILNHGRYGVFLENSTRSLVTLCKIHDGTEHQVRIKEGAFNTVVDNEIYDGASAQRALSTDTNADNVTFRRNTIYDTRGTPLQRGARFDATTTNVDYGDNHTQNLVVGNYLNDSSPSSRGYTKRGVTAGRPTLSESADEMGSMYLDTTLAANGKPIFWTGLVWVDGLGVVV
jgi:hypothetical protein